DNRPSHRESRAMHILKIGRAGALSILGAVAITALTLSAPAMAQQQAPATSTATANEPAYKVLHSHVVWRESAAVSPTSSKGQPDWWIHNNNVKRAVPTIGPAPSRKSSARNRAGAPSAVVWCCASRAGRRVEARRRLRSSP